MLIRIRNNRGQSLVEYLLLVALMAIGTISVLRTLNKTVEVNFANVASSLQGKGKVATHDKINKTDFQKRDMGNFMSGSSGRKTGGSDQEND